MLLSDLVKTAGLSTEKAYDLLNSLSEVLSTDVIERFVRGNISYCDAVDIATSDDSFRADYLELNPLDPLELAEQVTRFPSEVAYHLANTTPAEATQLLEELLYYRKQGRI